MMNTIFSFFKSLVFEGQVALISSISMYYFLKYSMIYLDVFTPDIWVLLLSYSIFFPSLCILLKTIFPIKITHKDVTIWVYLPISYFSTILFLVTTLDASGECWDCKGNINDVVFYTIVIGSIHAAIYCLTSSLGSVNFVRHSKKTKKMVPTHS